MDKKESALLSVAADQQGQVSNSGNTISHNVLLVKSAEEKNLEYRENTFTRFQLQHVAQKIIRSRFPWFSERNYTKCHRVALGAYLALVRNPKTDRGYFNHVVTCANPFLCPVCSPRIMGIRRIEVETAVKHWLDESPDNTCYHMVFTVQHNFSCRLSELLKQLKSASKKFWEAGTINRLLKSSGRVGRISATEIQFGVSAGWHPHFHVLLFCKRTAFNQDELSGYWLNALSAVGLSGAVDVAFKIQEARSAASYITKFSFEMTFGNLKKGRGEGHFAPFQLLYEASTGETWAADRFAELFQAAYGMHCLCWSRGLKQRFGIGEFSDKDITENKVDGSELEPFVYFVREILPRMSPTDKALLRNCAAVNDYSTASKILSRFGLPFSQNEDDL